MIGISIPLLPLIDLDRDSVSAGWQLSDGVLTGPARPTSLGWLQLPYCPPAEYDLSLCAERKNGPNGLNLGLVVGGRRVSVIFDGYDGTISGLHLVEGKQYCDNATGSMALCCRLGRAVSGNCFCVGPNESGATRPPANHDHLPENLPYRRARQRDSSSLE